MTDTYTRIDIDAIRNLVYRFYDRIRVDDMLGPIFNGVIGDNWDTHLETMVQFWSSTMLRTGAYEGRPLPKHVGLKDVTPQHFDHWLELFYQTTAETFAPDLAEAFNERAKKIAYSFQLAMFYRPENSRIINARNNP